MKLLLDLLRHPKFWIGFVATLAIGSVLMFVLSRLIPNTTDLLFVLQMLLMMGSSIALLLSERKRKRMKAQPVCTKR